MLYCWSECKCTIWRVVAYYANSGKCKDCGTKLKRMPKMADSFTHNEMVKIADGLKRVVGGRRENG